MTALAFSVAKPSSSALRAINHAPVVELLRGRPHDKLRDLVASVGDSYWSVFTRRDCDPELGVQLLSQTDMFAAEPSGRVIRRDSMAKPDLHLVEKWQVLIAGAGQTGESTLFGRSIIADDRLVGGYLGPHAVGLKFAHTGSDENLLVYAFLNSSLGLAAIKSCAFGTSVPGLRVDLLSALPIPRIQSAAASRIIKLIRDAVRHRDEYVVELKAARGVIERLPEMEEAREMCAQRRARCISWKGSLPSLSAWNFASVGGALDLLSRRWQARLRDVVEPDGVFNGPRFARVPCDAPHGVDFVSQRDVFLIRPIPRRIRHPGVSDDQLYVPKNTLLVGGHGTLGEGEIFGRVEYVSDRLSQTALTQDLLRVQPTSEFAEVAYAYLSTLVGFRLLRTTAVGTKILSMRTDLLLGLPFPEVGASTRAVVARHLTAAVNARDRAEANEEEANRLVEREIENHG